MSYVKIGTKYSYEYDQLLEQGAVTFESKFEWEERSFRHSVMAKHQVRTTMYEDEGFWVVEVKLLNAK